MSPCRLLNGTLAAAALVIAAASVAQTYPTKPIRRVAAAVGGGIDFTARLLADGMS